MVKQSPRRFLFPISVTEAENQIRRAIQWADEKNQPTARFHTLLGRLYIDWNISKPRWDDAIKAFETARGEDPDYYGNYWGIGRALSPGNPFQESGEERYKPKS
jgi:uncharacterized protein HemY